MAQVMKRFTRAIRETAVFLLTGTMLVHSVSGMVLCIGHDGHIAVEPVHQGQCSPSEDMPAPAAPDGAHVAANTGPEGAGGCVDVSLGLDKVSHIAKVLRQHRVLRDTVSRYLPAGHGTQASAGGYGARRLSCGGTPRPSHSLLAQRTIVLRS